MYVPLVLLGFAALLVGGHALLSWLLVESEEQGEGSEPRRRRSFYDPRTWAAFRRLLSKRPALLTYRRDRLGRFRKMSAGPARPPRRKSRPRPGRGSRGGSRRGIQIPAE